MTQRTVAISGEGRGTDPNRRDFLKTSAAIATGVAVGSMLPGPASAATPATGPQDFFDLRAQNCITSIKDQGACHSCTAFGVIATIEGSHHWQKNSPISTTNPGLDLSEADLFVHGPADCNVDHWWPKGALEYCKNTGVLREPPTTDTYKIADMQQLVVDDVTATITAMKNWISDTTNKRGPLVAVMVEYDDFLRFGLNRTTGTDVTDVYKPGWETGNIKPVLLGGHVVSIVGYEDRANANYWICKNSWFIDTNEPWNGNGFVRIQMRGRSYIERINVWGVKVP
jgi:Papain family cysteine protease/TAT (twin-arginine translocation) pathway signal sequence